MRVNAYRNLNRRDAVWYSIRHKGKVVEYRQFVVLSSAKMKHATSKQLDAVRRGPRQVCQWVTGDLGDITEQQTGNDRFLRRLCCDPKKHDGFCDAETGKRIDFASWVTLKPDGSMWYLPGFVGTV